VLCYPLRASKALSAAIFATRPYASTKEKIDPFAVALIDWLKVPTNVRLKDFCLDRDIIAD